MIVSITCSLAALLYNAVPRFDWTATTVVRFAWKAVVGRSHARAARAPIIFGYQVVVTARKIIVVGPLTVVVAVTLLNKETIVTNIRLNSSFRLPKLCFIRIIRMLFQTNSLISLPSYHHIAKLKADHYCVCNSCRTVLPGKDIQVGGLRGWNIFVIPHRWSHRILVSRGTRHCNTLHRKDMWMVFQSRHHSNTGRF